MPSLTINDVNTARSRGRLGELGLEELEELYASHPANGVVGEAVGIVRQHEIEKARREGAKREAAERARIRPEIERRDRLGRELDELPRAAFFDFVIAHHKGICPGSAGSYFGEHALDAGYAVRIGTQGWKCRRCGASGSALRAWIEAHE